MSVKEVDGSCKEWLCNEPQVYQTSTSQVIDRIISDDGNRPIQRSEPKTPLLFQELLTLVEKATAGFFLKISLAKIIIHVISGKPLNEISSNSYEYSMALQWINNAVEGVMDDPFRSFLEIILNAIDAGVSSNEAVGQFGLGLKSAFAFLTLKETNGGKIFINTQSEYAKGIRLDFEYDCESKEIYVEFKSIDSGYTFDSGTSVKVIPNFPFSSDSLKKIAKYTFHASQTTKAILRINFNNEVQTVGNSRSNHLVEVDITPGLLQVRDYGRGITPLETLANMLNIGNSTKKEAKTSSQRKGECFFYFSLDRRENHRPQVKIFVNSIVVFEQEIPFQFKINEYLDICVHLPYCPQVTSRNQILIHPKIILDLIDKTLVESVTHPRLICALYVALQAWENHSSNEEIKSVYTTYLKERLTEWINDHPDVLVINIEHASFFNHLLPSDVNRIFLLPSLANFNFRRLEKFLQLYLAEKCVLELEQIAITGRLIPGRNIAFVGDSILQKPTDFKFWNLIFFPRSWLNKGSREVLVEEISYTFPHLRPLKENELGFLFDKLELIRKSYFEVPKNFEEELKHFNALLSANDLLNVLSKEQRTRLENFRQSYLTLLGHALNFDLSKETSTYVCYKKKITSIYEKSTWNFYSPILQKTLKLLKAHPLLYNKILDWTIEHWSNIAEVHDNPTENKPRLLSGEILVMPGPTYTSPIGLLAFLINNRIDLQIIFQIIQESRNLYDFMILGNLISLAKQKSTLRIMQFSSTSNYYEKRIICYALRHYIEYILHCQITFEELKGWYFTNIWGSVDSMKVDSYLEKFVSNIAETHKKLENHPRDSFITSDVTLSLASTQVSFSIKQLIQAIIFYPNLRQVFMQGRLREGLSYICEQKGITTDRVQQLIQSTNAQPYYQACGVALLRHSVEALRTHFFTNKDILFKVEMLSHGRIYFSVQNFVGFHSLSELLDFFVIDHKNNDIFILYKRARQVIITTRVLLENKVYIVSVTPNLNVGDLQVRIVEASEEFLKKNPNFTGTKIEVCTLPVDGKIVHAEYLNAHSSFRLALESSNLMQDEINLWLYNNNDWENVRNSFVEIFRCHANIAVSRTSSVHQQSFVTIGGVFFQSFALFNKHYKVMPPNFFRYFQNGINLDLPNQYGKVLQNRCEIILTAEQIHELRVTLANAFYLQKFEESKGNCFIYSDENGHIGNIDQFYIIKYPDQFAEYLQDCEEGRDLQSIENFMTHFIPSVLHNSPYKNFREYLAFYVTAVINLRQKFLSRINEEFRARETTILANAKGGYYSQQRWAEIVLRLKTLIEKWKNELLHHKSEMSWIPVPNIPKDQAAFLKNLFDHGVLPWIKKKFNPGEFPIIDDTTIRRKFASVLKSEVEELPPLLLQLNGKNITDYRILLSLTSKALEVLMECLSEYCKLYLQRINVKLASPIVLPQYNENSTTAASYHRNGNLIKINFRHVNVDEFFELLSCIAARGNKKVLEIMYKLFVPNLTAGCLINHELEHCIQNQVCKEGFHGYVKNIEGHWVPFESSAISRANHVIYFRFLLEWRNVVEKILSRVSGQMDFEVFVQLSKLLRTERINHYVMSRCCKS